MRPASIYVKVQVQLGHGLALVLRAVRSRTLGNTPRRKLWNGPHRDPLCPMRQSSGTRFSGWSPSDRPAILSEFGLAGILSRGSRHPAKELGRLPAIYRIFPEFCLTSVSPLSHCATDAWKPLKTGRLRAKNSVCLTLFAKTFRFCATLCCKSL